jgi:aspartate-semialdehyde dehydrogenase
MVIFFMSKLGIVGVTGVVGNKFLEVIDEYNLVFDEIRLFASKKSEGKIIKFQNKDYVINSLNEGNDVSVTGVPNNTTYLKF